jgi:peptide/nickel transport system ATP-binding protein
MTDTGSQSSPLLELENLNVYLPTVRGRAHAIRHLSLTLGRGQTLGLIGESGCGKSLTALAIMGLLPERAEVTGAIRLHGQSLTALDDDHWCRLRGARMAMIFQEPMTALNPLHTIGRQIAEPLQLHLGLDARAARQRALMLLERVQLPRARERLDAYPHQLSGGQRQRVMISIALACSPDLLIADEPTTALDVTVQKEVLDLIGELVREDGMGLLLISHDLGLMHDRVEQVMVMYGGSAVEHAATPALFEQAAHPYTLGLFAARPGLDLPRGARLRTIAGHVPELVDLPVGCTFAGRCEKARQTCASQTPAWQTLPPMVSGQVVEHRVACPYWSGA